MKIHQMSLRALQAAIAHRELSASEVMQASLERIRSMEASLGAFISLDEEAAVRQAKAVDANPEAGALQGIPVVVKDNICVKQGRTTCASKILKDFVSPYSATVVEKLTEAGCILVGKTNLDEFGMGSTTEHSAFHITRNPHDLARVPGGSSGGSAAAVAAGMVPLALGSDTGGSIRQPASH